MPYARRNKKMVKRRPRRRSQYSIVRSLKSPMPYKLQTILKYCAQVTINPGVGAMTYHSFAVNSIYDPDVTSTGHQPLGHDELSIFYKRYNVKKSKISVTFSSRDSEESTGGAIVGILQNTDTSLPSVPSTFMEQPNTRYRVLGDGDSSRGIVTVSNSWSGNSMDEYSKSSVLAGSSPSNLQYFHVGAGSLDGIADPSTVTCNIHVQYTVEFSQLNDLVSS